MRPNFRHWTRDFRLFYRLSSIVSIVYCLSCLLSCAKGKEGKESYDGRANQITLNFEMEESSSGKRLYQIFAERAVFYEEKGVIEVSKVKVNFFFEDKITSTLSAWEGKVFTRTSDLVAKGDVKVATADSTYLFTDSLVWNNRAQRIETDAFVKIKSPAAEIEGEGLISDANLSRITIKSEIKGESRYRFK